jgi:hypothetical protein
MSIAIGQPNTDNFAVDQVVACRFTNSHRILGFTGKIVGKTKNYWKVESITTPYEGEAPGRIFHVATIGSRKYSANNCIVALMEEPAPAEEPKTPPANSYAPEVIADSTGNWTGNGLRFATREEAQANVSELYSRRTSVRETRVVESNDPPNYRWVDGRLEKI